MKYFQTCSWTRNCTNDFEIETNVHIIDIIDTFLHHLKIVWKENFERNTTWHKRKTTTKQMSSNRPFFCCKQNMVLSISNDQNWKEVSNNVYHVMSIFHRYPKWRKANNVYYVISKGVSINIHWPKGRNLVKRNASAVSVNSRHMLTITSII